MRRNRIDLNTPAELAIRNAVNEVEKAGADVKLTLAVIKLDEARCLVANYFDSLESEDSEQEPKRRLPESESNYER